MSITFFPLFSKTYEKVILIVFCFQLVIWLALVFEVHIPQTKAVRLFAGYSC
jgi:hypothetical protein